MSRDLSEWCGWCRAWQPDPLHDCRGDPDWVRSDKRKQRRDQRVPCPYCSNPVAPADLTAHLNRRCPKRPEET
jgi:hypothetical protein